MRKESHNCVRNRISRADIEHRSFFKALLQLSIQQTSIQGSWYIFRKINPHSTHRSWLTRTLMRGQARNLTKLSLLPTVIPPRAWFTVTCPPNSNKAYIGTYNNKCINDRSFQMTRKTMNTSEASLRYTLLVICL